MRGYLSAYDAETGKLVWRFYATPNRTRQPDGAASDAVLEKAAGTWGGGVPAERRRRHRLGFDRLRSRPEPGLLRHRQRHAVGAGRTARTARPTTFSSPRSSRSNADTGKYVWHYQDDPRRRLGLRRHQPMILADLTIDGAPRKVLMQANKNGFFYVLDRANGQLICANGYRRRSVSWATGGRQDRPADREPRRALRSEPDGGLAGALRRPQLAADRLRPQRGPRLHPGHGVGLRLRRRPELQVPDGGWNLGLNYGFVALPDDKAQRAAMKASAEGRAGGLGPGERQGALDRAAAGVLERRRAGHRRRPGVRGRRRRASSSPTTAKDRQAGSGATTPAIGITAAPMTYAVGGQQYVAMMVGYGGAAPLLPTSPCRTGRACRAACWCSRSAGPTPPRPSRAAGADHRPGRRHLHRRHREGRRLFHSQLRDLPRPQRLGPLPARPEDLADDPHPEPTSPRWCWAARWQVERHGQLRQVADPHRRRGDPRLHHRRVPQEPGGDQGRGMMLRRFGASALCGICRNRRCFRTGRRASP